MFSKASGANRGRGHSRAHRKLATAHHTLSPCREAKWREKCHNTHQTPPDRAPNHSSSLATALLTIMRAISYTVADKGGCRGWVGRAGMGGWCARQQQAKCARRGDPSHTTRHETALGPRWTLCVFYCRILSIVCLSPRRLRPCFRALDAKPPIPRAFHGGLWAGDDGQSSPHGYSARRRAKRAADLPSRLGLSCLCQTMCCCNVFLRSRRIGMIQSFPQSHHAPQSRFAINNQVSPFPPPPSPLSPLACTGQHCPSRHTRATLLFVDSLLYTAGPLLHFLSSLVHSLFVEHGTRLEARPLPGACHAHLSTCPGIGKYRLSLPSATE